MIDGIAPIPVAIPAALPMAGAAPSATAPLPAPRMHLTRQQKAAVVVQLLLAEGANPPLANLPEEYQEEITKILGQMRTVDRDTLQSVVAEFVGEMDSIGLTFPVGMEDALGAVDGHISAATSARLRREAGIAARGDPWERISGLAPDRLIKVLEQESTEVGAVMLSKLAVSQAAALLGMLPGMRARELSYAISRTGHVMPETVRRIGLSLAAQFDAEPMSAFDVDPVERVGAILNCSRAATRDDVLEGLDQTDAQFAAEVRRAIFTFANIPGRVTERDIPKIVRGIEQVSLVKALGHCEGDSTMETARDFILDNISKRMAESLREQIAEFGKVSESEGEEAMNLVIAEVRRLVEAGEVLLLADDG